ncbi:hypothetical protein [Paenibacillus sp. NPDC057934]|uniref:hypothetical protein n=1 Tax=Paenibacillus sp. NPDC057934 TaxID=3346282 RepID=UPI0036DE7EE1
MIEKIAEMQNYLEKIDYKIWFYQTAIESGTAATHTQNNCVFTEGMVLPTIANLHTPEQQ